MRRRQQSQQPRNWPLRDLPRESRLRRAHVEGKARIASVAPKVDLRFDFNIHLPRADAEETALEAVDERRSVSTNKLISRHGDRTASIVDT